MPKCFICEKTENATRELVPIMNTSLFEIRENVEIIIHGDSNICPHCHSDHRIECKGFDDHAWYDRVCTCPRVVVAWNEGGCNTTGVCLDCILEASETLAELEVEP